MVEAASAVDEEEAQVAQLVAQVLLQAVRTIPEQPARRANVQSATVGMNNDDAQMTMPYTPIVLQSTGDCSAYYSAKTFSFNSHSSIQCFLSRMQHIRPRVNHKHLFMHNENNAQPRRRLLDNPLAIESAHLALDRLLKQLREFLLQTIQLFALHKSLTELDGFHFLVALVIISIVFAMLIVV